MALHKAEKHAAGSSHDVRNIFVSVEDVLSTFIEGRYEVDNLFRTEGEQHDVGDDTEVAQENDDRFPVAHSNVLLRQLSFENMDGFVLILDDLNSVGDQDQKGG